MNRPSFFCLFRKAQRKLGDSNPRYGNPHGSLANCWFQPLTQTSLPKRFSLNYISLLKCECKGRHIFLYHQTFDELFLKKLFFSTSISVFRRFLQSLFQKKGSQTTFLRLVLLYYIYHRNVISRFAQGRIPVVN